MVQNKIIEARNEQHNQEAIENENEMIEGIRRIANIRPGMAKHYKVRSTYVGNNGHLQVIKERLKEDNQGIYERYFAIHHMLDDKAEEESDNDDTGNTNWWE